MLVVRHAGNTTRLAYRALLRPLTHRARCQGRVNLLGVTSLLNIKDSAARCCCMTLQCISLAYTGKTGLLHAASMRKPVE